MCRYINSSKFLKSNCNLLSKQVLFKAFWIQSKSKFFPLYQMIEWSDHVFRCATTGAISALKADVFILSANIKFSSTYRQGKQSPNIIQPFVSISCSTWLSVGENLLFKGLFTLTSGKPLVSSHQKTGTCLGLLVSSRFSLSQQTKQFLEKIYGKIKARCLLFQQDIKCSSQPNLLRKKHQLSFTVPL